MPLDISVSSHGDILEINLNGQLDATSSPALHDTLMHHIGSGSRMFAMNFSGLLFISSAGLRVLLVALKRIQRGNGRIHLYGVNDQVREIFDLAGLLPLFPIHASSQEAMESLKQK